MANCGCKDFSRSQALRKLAAEAGRGLPAIEPGMPMPAGTGLTRRSFISRTSGLALAVYGATSLGPKAFEEGIAAAAAQAGDQKVLVSVFFSGGVGLAHAARTQSVEPPSLLDPAPDARTPRRTGHGLHRGHDACAGIRR